MVIICENYVHCFLGDILLVLQFHEIPLSKTITFSPQKDVLLKGGLGWKMEWKTELKNGMENGNVSNPY